MKDKENTYNPPQSEQYIALCRIADEQLLAGHANCVANLFSDVISKAKSDEIAFDGAIVLEYFWSLARIGAVAVPGGTLGNHLVDQKHKIPGLLLTERGRRFFEQGEKSPHNPNKYMSDVRRRVGNPDDVVLSYLSEAVEAWRYNLNRSSAVMLGCACERLILLLAKTIASNKSLSGSDKIDKALKKRVYISKLFDEVRKTLTTLKSDKTLPKKLGDAIDRRLAAIFDHARGLRNDSGHPTDKEVSSEEAHSGLILFPGFYELVYKIISEITT